MWLVTVQRVVQSTSKFRLLFTNALYSLFTTWIHEMSPEDLENVPFVVPGHVTVGKDSNNKLTSVQSEIWDLDVKCKKSSPVIREPVDWILPLYDKLPQCHAGDVNVAGTDFCLLHLFREIYHTVLARTRAWLNYLSVMKNNSIMFIHAKNKEKVKREIKCRLAAELHYFARKKLCP